MYSIVRHFLRERAAQITLGNSVSSKRVIKGCPQESVSGPTLWNIIISDLIALLSNAPNVRIVVFADDIMITIQGPSPSAILTTLQSTLQTIKDWCKVHRLEIAKEKSALMPVFIRKREEYKWHLTIVAWGINVVSKMIYFVIILDSKLDWFPHTQYLENKLPRIRNSLVRCSKATSDMSFHNLMTFISNPYSQPLHTPQKSGVSRYPNEQNVNCNKFRDLFPYS